MQLPKNHVEFCNMLYSCIDLSEHDEGATLLSIIQSEKRYKCPVGPDGKTAIPSIEVVEDWLRGLPSACSIPYDAGEVQQILAACGNGHWSDDDYWRFAASRIREFALRPELYK